MKAKKVKKVKQSDKGIQLRPNTVQEQGWIDDFIKERGEKKKVTEQKESR